MWSVKFWRKGDLRFCVWCGDLDARGAVPWFEKELVRNLSAGLVTLFELQFVKLNGEGPPCTTKRYLKKPYQPNIPDLAGTDHVVELLLASKPPIPKSRCSQRQRNRSGAQTDVDPQTTATNWTSLVKIGSNNLSLRQSEDPWDRSRGAILMFDLGFGLPSLNSGW